MSIKIPGSDKISSLTGGLSFGKLLSGAYQFVLLLILFFIVGGIFYYFFYLSKKKKQCKNKISWYEEVNGRMSLIGTDNACELIIPGTNISVFYIKSKDMYLPRPTKKMGDNLYWFAIRDNREIVNFSIKNLNEEMKEANLDYDHTDMRYALENLRDLIKRNYRDKATPWWREYKDVISIVIYVFVLTLSFIFIVGKVGTLIDKVGVLINHADKLIQVAKSNPSSGVILK